MLRQHPELVSVLEGLQTALSADPRNHTGEQDITKLTGVAQGEGQWRIPPF